MSAEIILIGLPSLLISLISISVFVYLGYRNRQRNDQLEERVLQLQQERVEHFLQREMQITQQRVQIARKNADTPAESIDDLRRIWLKAELVSLVDAGRHRSNQAELQKAALPLQRMLKHVTKTVAGKAADSRDTISDQIEKARNALTLQIDSIAQIQRANANTASISAQKTALTTTLDHAKENTSELVAIIARLESELLSLNQKYENTAAKLQEAQHSAPQKAAGEQPHELLIISTSTQTESKLGATRKLLQETVQAYQQSFTEMNRMREINSKQRTLILQLGNEISLLKKDSEQYETSSEILEKMKLQLRDYETCTVILESESETLRDKITQLTSIIGQENNSEQPTSFAPPRPGQIDDTAKAQANAAALIFDIIKLVSAEQVLGRLIEWLAQKSLPSVIFMRGQHDQLWVSSEGNVDSHSRQLLQSITAEPGKPLVEIKEGLLFAYPFCSVLIYQSPNLASHTEELLRALHFVDRWLAMTEAQKMLSQENRAVTEIRTYLSQLLGQYSYVITEHKRTTGKFDAELEELLVNSALPERQREYAREALDDFKSQQDIIGKASKLVYTGLKALIQDLEKSETP